MCQTSLCTHIVLFRHCKLMFDLEFGAMLNWFRFSNSSFVRVSIKVLVSCILNDIDIDLESLHIGS